MNRKIITHLWYDKEAREAAEFYVSVFGQGSKVTSTSKLHNTPSGTVDVVTFELLGREFQAISAGPLFKFNPSVSFHVISKTKAEVDALWKKLSEGGTVLKELKAYPFSEKYGWVQDKYGLSWQIVFFSTPEAKRKITPLIMFSGSVCGKAEEAVKFWTSVFPEGKIDGLLHFPKGEEPNRQGTLKYASFSLLGNEFGAMDSAQPPSFTFNEAISFVVGCDTQEEIDHYWKKLTAVPQAEQCGWLKDKYGLSWQIVPVVLGKMLQDQDAAKVARVTEAFLKMKKFDIAGLMKAFGG